MSKFYLNPYYKNTEIGEKFSSVEKIFSLQGERISHDDQSNVLRSRIGGKVFYVKQFFKFPSLLRKHVIRSRAEAEFYNLKYLESLGLPIPRIVAFGLTSLFGGFGKQKAVLVTEAVENTMDLDQLAQERQDIFSNTRWRRQQIQQLANYIRRLHEHHFTHSDLNWRNILVELDVNNPQLFFIDVPLGARRFFTFNRFMKKDLLLLNRKAEEYLSNTDRLRFYLQYKGVRYLREADKKFLRTFFLYVKEKKLQRSKRYAK